jgi:hypothetical protein
MADLLSFLGERVSRETFPAGNLVQGERNTKLGSVRDPGRRARPHTPVIPERPVRNSLLQHGRRVRVEDQTRCAQIPVPPYQNCAIARALFPSPRQGEVDARPRASGEGPRTARDYFRARLLDSSFMHGSNVDFLQGSPRVARKIESPAVRPGRS